MATYNGARYLPDQLQSFLRQTVMPDELVVCDDVSTDDSVSIIRDFAKSTTIDVRLIVNRSNVGFTRNFEQAVQQCNGDVIFFCDQDDVWFSRKIEIMLRSFQEHPEKLLVAHDGELVNERLDAAGVTMRRQLRA